MLISPAAAAIFFAMPHMPRCFQMLAAIAAASL